MERHGTRAVWAVRTARSLAIAVVLVAACGAASAASAASAAGTGGTIAVVPFYNVAGAPDAVATLTPLLEARLARLGLAPADSTAIESFLRERRIRARHQISADALRELAAEVGARYAMLGTIDAWRDDDGPEIALSARILRVDDGNVVWSDAASLRATAAPGVLALLRADDLEEAAARAVRDLLSGLSVRRDRGGIAPSTARGKPRRALLADRPIAFRSPRLDPARPLRVVVLPFENRTLEPEAPQVVHDHLTAWLTSRDGIDVVDPGELRRVLVEHDIQPIYGFGTLELHLVRRILDADALVDGRILRFESDGPRAPRVDLYARLRDTSTGEILWAATTEREGDDTRTLYDHGRIESVDRLVHATVADLLSTWFR